MGGARGPAPLLPGGRAGGRRCRSPGAAGAGDRPYGRPRRAGGEHQAAPPRPAPRTGPCSGRRAATAAGGAVSEGGRGEPGRR